MRYAELKIEVNRTDAEMVQAALIGAGFDAMQIEDALDAKDIAEHPDIYKYDYINEEITERAKGAASGETAGALGEDGCGTAGEPVVIMLYFADDEEGRERLAEATAILERISAAYTDGETTAAGRSLTAAGPARAEDTDRISWNISETGDDSEWLFKWQEHFRPVKVGECIVVKPSWEDYTPADGELVIEMDPGMAFGSGLHETTSMCIRALEEILRLRVPEAHSAQDDKNNERNGEKDLKGLKVLDVGTGTGILSIAAALLGAEDCLGIDIDDEAVRVAGENVERNGLAGSIRIAKGDLTEGVSYDADIIVANLMADLVIRLTPAAAGHLKKGGVYITSGILDVKEETVADAICDAGFDILEVLRDGEWRAITAVKR